MNSYKDIMLVTLGACLVLAYQKYHEPVMKTVDKTVDKALKSADKKLQEMM